MLRGLASPMDCLPQLVRKVGDWGILNQSRCAFLDEEPFVEALRRPTRSLRNTSRSAVHTTAERFPRKPCFRQMPFPLPHPDDRVLPKGSPHLFFPFAGQNLRVKICGSFFDLGGGRAMDG